MHGSKYGESLKSHATNYVHVESHGESYEM